MGFRVGSVGFKVGSDFAKTGLDFVKAGLDTFERYPHSVDFCGCNVQFVFDAFEAPIHIHLELGHLFRKHLVTFNKKTEFVVYRFRKNTYVTGYHGINLFVISISHYRPLRFFL